MREDLPEVTIPAPYGGINKHASTLIPPNQAVDLINVDLSTEGAVTKRTGMTRWNSSQVGLQRIRSLYRARKVSDNTNAFLCTYTNVVRSGWSGTFNNTVDSGLSGADPPFTFVEFRNSAGTEAVYYANGDTSDIVRKWTYTGSGSAVTASPPLTDIVVHYAKLFGIGDPSNPNRLYYTQLRDGDTWNTTTNFEEIAPADGDILMRIIPAGGVLFAVKQNNIYVVSGQSKDDPFQVPPTNLEIGSAAPRSCVYYAGWLYFLGWNGFYRFNGANLQLLSKDIQSLVDAINKSSIQQVAGIAWKDLIIWAYPSGSNTENDKVLVLDLRRSENGPFCWYEIQGWPLACFAHQRSETDADTLYGGSSAAVGYAYRLFNGSDDDGTTIDMTWTTKDFSVRHPATKSILELVWEGLIMNDLTTTAGLNVRASVDRGTNYEYLGWDEFGNARHKVAGKTIRFNFQGTVYAGMDVPFHIKRVA